MKLKKTEAERNSAPQPVLAKQYRAIGPAAIVAALLHTSKKRKPANTHSTAVKAA